MRTIKGRLVAAPVLCALWMAPAAWAQDTFSLTPTTPFVGSDYSDSTWDVKPGEVDFHFGTVTGSVTMQGPSVVVGSPDSNDEYLVFVQPATFITQQTISGADSVSITVDAANSGDTSCPQFGPCTFHSLLYFPREQPPLVAITTTLTITAGSRYSFDLTFYWNVTGGTCPVGSSGIVGSTRTASSVRSSGVPPASGTTCDTISFATNANGTSVYPQPDEVILGDSSNPLYLPAFFAAVTYSLNSAQNGKIVLQLTDQDGNPLPVPAGPPVQAIQGTDQIAGSSDQCVGDSTTIGGNCLFIPKYNSTAKTNSVIAVKLVALLEDSSGKVLAKTNSPINYPVQPPQVHLTLGGGGAKAFFPVDQDVLIVSGTGIGDSFRDQDPTIQVVYTYPGDKGTIQIVASTDTNGVFYRGRQTEIQNGTHTSYISYNPFIPRQGGTLFLYAVVTSSAGQQFSIVPPILFRMETLSISMPLVDPKGLIPCNTPLKFGFTVSYNTAISGGYLTTKFSYPGSSEQVDGPMFVQGDDFITRTYTAGVGCSSEEAAPVFFQASLSVSSVLDDKNVPAASARVSYGASHFVDPTKIAAGPGTTSIASGSITTTQNTTTRNVTSSTSGSSLGTVQVQSASPKPQAIRPESAASSAAASPASAIPNYIGIYRTWQFSPPIAANAGFAANLTLDYSMQDLPDDPNFDETKLQMVSFDPSTGTFSSYVTTLDLTNKTATASVNGLAPYYSLATLGPFSNMQIDLPLFDVSNGFDTKIAIVNPGGADTHLKVSGYGSDGTLLPNSPVAATVASNSQLLKSISAVGFDTSISQTGWAQTPADSVVLVGAETIINGAQFDALPLATGHPTSSVITDIEFDDRYSTEIDVVNPALNPRNLTLMLYTSDGAMAGIYTGTIDPKSTFSASADLLFPSITSPFAGYLTVTGDGDVIASALLSSFSNLTGVASHSVNAQASGALTLYGARLGASGQFTRVILVNVGPTVANLTFTAYKADGSSAGKPVTSKLASGAQMIADLATLFGFDGSNPTAGSFTVTSDQPTVFGDLTFGDFSFAQVSRASVPLVNAGAMNLVVPYVENDSAAQAAINISNPNGGSASVTVTTFDSTGKQQGSTSVTIPPNGSATPITPGTVSGGFVTLSSTQPVVAFAVIAPASGGDFAAIPAQPVASVTTGPGGGGLAPQITPGGVVNAADYVAKVSRGALAFAFGNNLASQSSQANALPLPFSMGGASVTVAGIPAPVFVVNPTFIEFQIPYEMPLGASVPVVVTNGAQSNVVDVTVADYAVGVFTYSRTSTIIDPDVFHLNGTLLTPTAPAVPGETVIVIANGIGKLNNPPRTGNPVGPPYPAAVDMPVVTVGGVPAVPQYSGLLAGDLGVVQMNLKLPANLPSGNLPLVIQFPGDSSPPVNLYVAGNVTAAPKLSLSTNSLAFGNVTVGQSKSLSLLVSNSGSAALTVGSMTIGGPGFTVVSPATPFTVQPGGSQTVTLSYAPSSAASVLGTLTIISNDAGSPATVSLSGTGLAAPAPSIGVNPTSLNFGTVTVGQTKDLTVAVSNTGGAQLIVSSLAVSTGFLVTSPVTPLNIAAGSSSNVTVRFVPTTSVAVTGALLITSNDPHTPTVTVQLNGIGTAAGQLNTVVLQVDGGTYNSVTGFSTGQTGAVFVNRLTPPSYPATLQNVQIYFGNRANGLAAGTPITLVYGTNPSGSANFNATFTLTPTQVFSVGSLNTYPVTPVTITSGDFVVGFQVDNPVGIYPADTDRLTPSQGRSYFAAGSFTFTLLDAVPGLAGNLAIRATVTVPQ